ncbi:MAG: hypothetical protein M3P24_11470, partial [Gemmatimonadota bacterium]|nr:hypothetical protein [Gemmatimonadota bacterium]
MLERLYLRLHDRLLRRPGLVLLLVGAAVAAALPVLLHLRLDMSFRPLFADEPAEAAATREFAAVFGQPSGAFVGVVVEPREGIGAPFLRRLSRLSGEVERLEHVVEVVSLARLAVPVGTGESTHGVWALPPELLERGPERRVQAGLEALRQDPRVRRVLLSEDGRRTLLLARLDLPLQDLQGRSRVIRAFRAHVADRLPDAKLHFVGVSVVEDEYARIVLVSLARSLGLTLLALVGVLWLVFHRAAPVGVALAGVSAATPVTLALMVGMGQALTMVNS